MLIVKEIKQVMRLEEVLSYFCDQPYLFCLDSALADAKRGRYSFIGFDPFDTYQTKGAASLNDLRGRFQKYQHRHYDEFSPFASGLVGFLSYDFGLKQEGLVSRAIDDTQLPDMFFGFYDRVLTIDHLSGKMHISSTGLGHQNNISRREFAKNRIDQMVALLNQKKREEYQPAQGRLKDLPLTSNLTREQYIQSVKKILSYIEQGEIYQANMSQRFSCAFDQSLNPLQIYLRLRQNFPTCFSSFLDGGSYQILSSSPERFLQRRKAKILTQPMKGTRRRAVEKEHDKRLYSELEESEKEKAELLMVTDLERNDLGRMCAYGSVRVEQMREIESYKNIFQAISTISGEMRPDKDSFDILSAVFPGGSITGCPKIQAMKVIDELEPTRRSIYTGALGYINFNGDMDFSILIRTLLMRDKHVSFQVGSGIVADSVPEEEYDETLVKSQAMLRTLQQIS